GEHALGEEPVHLADHVVVVRCILHRRGLALHVHQADRHAELRRGIERAVAAQCTHVVDQSGAGGHGGAHDLGLGRVDRDRHRATARERLDHRHDARDLIARVDRRRPRARRLATDVEQVGALGDEAQAMLDSAPCIEEFAAVRERIGGHVDDAGDAGPAEVERALGAIKQVRDQGAPLSKPSAKITSSSGTSTTAALLVESPSTSIDVTAKLATSGPPRDSDAVPSTTRSEAVPAARVAGYVQVAPPTDGVHCQSEKNDAAMPCRSGAASSTLMPRASSGPRLDTVTPNTIAWPGSTVVPSASAVIDRSTPADTVPTQL